MTSNPFLSLSAFTWTITALLMTGALLPKLKGLFPNKSASTLLWRAPLVLIVLAGGYAVALGASYLAVSPSTSWYAVWWNSSWAPGLPPLQLELGLDSLAAFFLLFVGFFALLVAFYSLGALTAEHYDRYRGYIAGGYSVFVWGSLMTILAYDVFSLLIILEITTLAFTALSLFKGQAYRHGLLDGEKWQRQEARLAPKVYLIISHASTVFLLLGFLLLAVPAHSLSFRALRAQAVRGDLTSFQNQAAFILLLIGLGIRAGFTPAHIWPPLVHPASPTTTHAFSLGMGIKVALFLMIRVFFQFLSPEPWWGLLLFLLAGITALINVWYALVSHDLKTALAYHSIENVGIMAAGIGLALYAFAHGASHPIAPLASLAMIAGLFHLVNHAIFKSLLYLATGSIENITHGQVHIARLGGILRLYPWTGLFFLVGAWAITGFPPFNGFVSEWLTIKANIGMLITYATQGDQAVILWRELFVLLLGFLLLIASFALTAICFYKIAGLTLLGQRQAKEAKWDEDDQSLWMLIPMGILALSALLLGLLPIPMYSLLERVITSLGLPVTPEVGPPLYWSAAEIANPIANWSISFQWGIVLLALATLVIVPFLLVRRGSRRTMAWQGGVRDVPSKQINPTGASLTWLVRKQFRYLSLQRLTDKDAKPRGFVNNTDQEEDAYLPDYIHVADSPIDSFQSSQVGGDSMQGVVEVFRYVVNIIIHKVFTWSTSFSFTVQNGDVRRYMTYIGVTYLSILILYMIFYAILK